ncbi:GntR family transcriptional regulator [Orrella sp. JC864]|uniref:GntR family transcriptional regulator n=1 Tax=Orrella sp. JC864 TaxID=3120298 RepID=UPI0012BBCB3A
MTEAPALAADPGSSLTEQAYQQLRRRILDNAWAPGYQALEQEIAQMLGMSRTPVREALIMLQREGLVKVIPRRGMRVLPMSPADMREIYQVLTALECMAVEIVARRGASESELQALEAATGDMAAALAADDLQAWADADARFHKQLVLLCGNRHLYQTVLNYWDRAHRARLFTLRLRPKPVQSTQEHQALVERLRAGDVQGAVQVNREHRERASRELLAIFERFHLQQV